ncbi:hypothetical protein GCM10023238_03080 [Streptomyces heliomycini]
MAVVPRGGAAAEDDDGRFTGLRLSELRGVPFYLLLQLISMKRKLDVTEGGLSR